MQKNKSGIRGPTCWQQHWKPLERTHWSNYWVQRVLLESNNDS